MNTEQTFPWQCDCEITVPFRSHLFASLTSHFVSYGLIFLSISQMWAATSHFLYRFSVFGSIYLGEMGQASAAFQSIHIFLFFLTFYLGSNLIFLNAYGEL